MHRTATRTSQAAAANLNIDITTSEKRLQEIPWFRLAFF
jgi:hypothetical protein